MKSVLPLFVLGLLVAFSFHGGDQWVVDSSKLPLSTCVDLLPVTGQDCTEGNCQSSCIQAHSGIGNCLNANTCFCTYPCRQ